MAAVFVDESNQNNSTFFVGCRFEIVPSGDYSYWPEIIGLCLPSDLTNFL